MEAENIPADNHWLLRRRLQSDADGRGMSEAGAPGAGRLVNDDIWEGERCSRFLFGELSHRFTLAPDSRITCKFSQRSRASLGVAWSLCDWTS